mmetsp:Transcript_230/g.775  ORF Transcript_230/g.775 Transcript_230/m.775 type:complete len:249 (-) Transcript_230:421-1167(-)
MRSSLKNVLSAGNLRAFAGKSLMATALRQKQPSTTSPKEPRPRTCSRSMVTSSSSSTHCSCLPSSSTCTKPAPASADLPTSARHRSKMAPVAVVTGLEEVAPSWLRASEARGTRFRSRWNSAWARRCLSLAMVRKWVLSIISRDRRPTEAETSSTQKRNMRYQCVAPCTMPNRTKSRRTAPSRSSIGHQRMGSMMCATVIRVSRARAVCASRKCLKSMCSPWSGFCGGSHSSRACVISMKSRKASQVR